MLVSTLLLPIVFFVSLAVVMISALLMLHPCISLNSVRIHAGIISLPPFLALLNLVIDNRNKIIGPWHLDPLAWLTALFVLTIGLVVQRYSVHYLLGNRHYRQYFAFLTLTTGSASVAWLSDDLRWILVCWGITLIGLTLLIRLNNEWQMAKNAAAITARLFGLSWLIMLVAIIWLTQIVGNWQLSLLLSKEGVMQLSSWERSGICLLLVLAVVIPAAQFPFHRWLIDSVVAPTPISAVMHAGVVNAGGIILTRFATLFDGNIAQIFLIVLSSISVLIGTGIILVQVDYKRQLVGSTIAQMGFMLIQCALGAYLAAIIHAVLHGLFKSTLFLHAGSAVHHNEHTIQKTSQSPFLWIIAGSVLGGLVGIRNWSHSNGDHYQLISAIILGWSLSFAWTKLVASSYGKIGKIAGISLLAGAGIMFNIILDVFYRLLHGTVYLGVQPSKWAIIWVLSILLSSVIGAWLKRHHSSKAFTVLYLWLVHLGEPHGDSVESHPKYLTLSQEVINDEQTDNIIR